MSANQPPFIPTRAGDPEELDFSSPDGDDFDALSRDHIPVRSMNQSDLADLVAIDRRATGQDRTIYYERKLHEVLHESGVRVSLIAELDGRPVGFMMARVDFGEFGRADTEAVVDTIGVDEAYRGRGVGHALMSQLMINLAALQVDQVRTEIDWNDTNLISYLGGVGFKPAQRIVLTRHLGP